MNVSPISMTSLQCKRVNFSGSSKQEEYENPINRSTEKNLAILSSAGKGLLVGGSAAGIASCFVENGFKQNKKLLAGVGLAAMAGTIALDLPSKLYNTKVNAYAKEKEMDVFSRDRALKSNIMEEVNNEIKDENVDLDKKLSHYTSVQMANNGRGLLFKEA